MTSKFEKFDATKFIKCEEIKSIDEIENFKFEARNLGNIIYKRRDVHGVNIGCYISLESGEYSFFDENGNDANNIEGFSKDKRKIVGMIRALVKFAQNDIYTRNSNFIYIWGVYNHDVNYEGVRHWWDETFKFTEAMFDQHNVADDLEFRSFFGEFCKRRHQYGDYILTSDINKNEWIRTNAKFFDEVRNDQQLIDNDHDVIAMVHDENGNCIRFKIGANN